MVKRNIISAFFLVLFLIILTQTTVYAAELTLPKVVINPDNYLIYSLKRLFEKTIIFTKLSKDSKMNYYKELTLTRMAELKNVVDQNLLSEVEQSTQRLSYQVGTLSDFISTDKTDLPNESQEISDLLNSLKNPLAILRDKYPANSAYWLLIQHNINSIDINLQKLK